jgi:hypothetical protein
LFSKLQLLRFEKLAEENGWTWADIENSKNCRVHLSASENNLRPGKPSSFDSPEAPKGASTLNVQKFAFGKQDGLPTLEGKKFSKAREEQTARLMELYRERLQVPVVPVIWSKKLNKTAGQARLVKQNQTRTATIELATKVVDSTEVRKALAKLWVVFLTRNRKKLRCTLAHEMCHAAAWIVDGVSKPPHGDAFKTWARRFEAKVERQKKEIEILFSQKSKKQKSS